MERAEEFVLRTSMNGVYSRRNQQPDVFRYDVPNEVRCRILHNLRQLADDPANHAGFDRILDKAGERLLSQYGGLRRPGYEAARQSNDPVIQHFFSCTDTEALDFIEVCVQVEPIGLGNQFVDIVNTIFREEAVGYELSRLIEHEVNEPARRFGRRLPGKAIRFDFPKFVRKDESTLHEQAVRPCLAVLSRPKLQTANAEMLKAHDDYRKGNFADAITSCGSAFESVLKTICDHHGWSYDPEKDTCSKLVGICKDKGLFPPFYAPIFEASGTIRNKLGDAHGRGPAPMYAVAKEHVDHMIQLTSAHIVLLVELAKF
jgi:hypothetical protein